MSDSTDAAIITGASQVATSGVNAYAQGRTNKKTREWNEKMYALQRENSLKDWAMQNEYNSPRAQMERFRDAGLNPNLIYGQSNSAGPVRSTEVQSWNPRAPQFDLTAGNTLGAYYDVQLKEASIDNLRVQNTVLTQEALLKAAQTASTTQGTAKSEFELSMANQLKNYTLEAAEANLRKLIVDTEYVINQDERAAAQNSYSIREAAERIIQHKLTQAKTREETENVKQQRQQVNEAIINMQKDGKLKDLDINLKKDGLQPGDNMVWRILGQLFDKTDIQKAMKGQTPVQGRIRGAVLKGIRKLTGD